MMNMQDRIYTEARISKSLVNDLWETDKNGNPIIIIEASNDNLDYQEERVLRSALMGEKDYFLQNGVISYDHKHLPSEDNYKFDPEWNAEKYVIGKPLDAWEGKDVNGEPVVKVKAVLSQSNSIAKEIITKLKDGLKTVRASVGGRRPRKEMMFDPKSFQNVPTITSVEWDEVALTYKPVNQTLGCTVLSPKEFVKSLTAGSSVNPAEMTGGNTLQMQSTEKKPISSLKEKLKNKEITSYDDAVKHFERYGFTKDEAKRLFKMVRNKFSTGEKIMGDEITKIDEETNELKKALEDLDKMEKAKKDGEFKRKGGFEYMKKADGSYESDDADAPDYNGDDDDNDKVEKALPDELIEEDFFDASEEVAGLVKSVADMKAENADMRSMLKSISDNIGLQVNLMKSMGTQVLADSDMLKAIKDAPQPRQTNVQNIQTMDRFEKAVQDKMKTVTPSSLMKSMVDNNIDPSMRATVSTTFRKSGNNPAVLGNFPEIVTMIGKE